MSTPNSSHESDMQMSEETSAIGILTPKSISHLAVDLLNEFFALDPVACRELMAYRVEVNAKVEKCPDLKVIENRSKFYLRFINVLNGILEKTNVEHGRVAMIVDENDKLLRFVQYQPNTADNEQA